MAVRKGYMVHSFGSILQVEADIVQVQAGIQYFRFLVPKLLWEPDTRNTECLDVWRVEL